MNSQEILQQNNAVLDENNAIIEDILKMVDNLPDSSVALNVYSTEEQIVGSWLNGKNVYRQVFVGSMTGMGTTWTNIAQVLDVDEVISLSGTISNTLTDGRSLNLNTYEDETHNACFSFCKEDNNHLQARVAGWSKTEWGFVFKLYFEYTKTTDAENSSTIISTSGSDRSLITIGLSSDTEFTSYNSSTIPLDIELNKKGSKLSFDITNNAVKIGAGVSKILVSGTITQVATAVGLYGGNINKNGTSLSTAINVGFNYIPVTNVFCKTTLPPVLVDVVEGDLICLTTYAEKNNTLTIKAYDGRSTNMTVEVIE